MWFAPAHCETLLVQWQSLGMKLSELSMAPAPGKPAVPDLFFAPDISVKPAMSGALSPLWQLEGRRLVRHWARWPRSYHDTNHLHACLRHAAQVESHLAQPHAVALALWFHDAVYLPWRKDNEERSADWAMRFMQQMRLPTALCNTVHSQIMATRHHAQPLAGDNQWVVDIDLAILGQPTAVYALFERNVRREYRFVPHKKYRAGRSAVLQSFLDRDAIYRTPHFYQALEATARSNLRQALLALHGASG